MQARAWVLGVLVVVGSCASCDEAKSPETNVAAVVTWNVGLAEGYVSYAPQRRPEILAAIPKLDADVVCLQEVWSQADASAVIAAAASVFPESYQVQLEDDTVGPPGCPPESEQVAALSVCATSKCGTLPSSELGGCVLGQCKQEFDAVPPSCVECLAANLGQALDTILLSCTTGSARYFAKGANGLVLLSKHPLQNRTHLAMTSTNTQRSVLGATVNLPGLGETDVYCTHIAADLESQLKYNGPYASWGAENLAQLDAIFAQIAATKRTDQILLLGDFNAGPAIPPQIAAELPDNYKHTIDAGWRDWPGTGADALCTFCPENTLISDTASGVLIDHIYGKGIPAAFSESRAARIETDTVTIETPDGPAQSHRSDHFGMRLQFDRSR
ncbi:MAG: endonuclease/exonuclease/phosphatase family protein [Myxococcota bacterium]